MPDYIPPTEAELEECLDVVGTETSYEYGEVRASPEMTRRLIAETRYLRELCRRAAPFVRVTIPACVLEGTRKNVRDFADELLAASKGEV